MSRLVGQSMRRSLGSRKGSSTKRSAAAMAAQTLVEDGFDPREAVTGIAAARAEIARARASNSRGVRSSKKERTREEMFCRVLYLWFLQINRLIDGKISTMRTSSTVGTIEFRDGGDLHAFSYAIHLALANELFISDKNEEQPPAIVRLLAHASRGDQELRPKVKAYQQQPGHKLKVCLSTLCGWVVATFEPL